MPENTISAEEILAGLFREHFGKKAESSIPVKGDGSGRRLFRITAGKKSVIGVINGDKEENTAFLEFSRHFRKCGLPVPEIYAADNGKGVYLEEDLGDATLFKFLSENRNGEFFPQSVIDIYRKVVRLLPEFQISAGKTLDYGVCYPISSFDKQSMMWDLNYFKYYFLRLAGIPFNEQKLEDDFKKFTDFLLSARRDFFLYRDFQSRNIMIRDGKPWFIDYQGGRKGALQYDIASLLFDAKADIPFALREELLEDYLKAVSGLIRLDRKKFMEHYHGYSYIRIMQALGAYGLRGFYERKTSFLQSIPYAIRNLEHLLFTSELPLELPALNRVFRNLIASSQLRQFGEAELKLTVRIRSFSYKDGIPLDEKGHGGGYVFDCRALPNPGKFAKYANLTGKDPEVIVFLEKEKEVRKFTDNVFSLVGQSVENYRKRNFTNLMVAFGCTGGKHRSVYCAELLAKYLRGKYKVNVEVRHREQESRAEALTAI